MYKIVLLLMFASFFSYSEARTRSFGKKRVPSDSVPSTTETDKVSTSEEKPGQKVLGRDDARHFLARTHFSVDLDDVEEIEKMTRDEAVNWLFNQQNFAGQPATPAWMKGYLHLLKVIQKDGNRPVPMNAMDSRPLTTKDLDMVLGELKDVDDSLLQRRIKRLYKKVEDPNSMHNMRHLRNLLFNDLQNWWFQQMVTTQAPIVEIMALFWHGHFTTEYKRVKNLQFLHQQNRLFRKYALGSFKNLLRDVSKGPAMLRYLDGARNRKNKPNENFAREVMELFTLGEGKGYQEQDIKEAARAFTGWTIKNNKFFFNPKRHDKGEKTIFGKTDKWGGQHVLDMLTEKKQTARNISFKIWKYFAGHHVKVANVFKQDLANVFYKSGYQVKPLLRKILISDAFYRSRAKVIKSPIDLLVGAVIDLDLEADYFLSLVNEADVLGQRLFNPPNVKGWPGGEYWINSASYLARKSLLTRLVRVNEKKKKKRKKPKRKKRKTVENNEMSAKKTKVKRGNNYKFDRDQWLSQFSNEQEAVFKMLPLRKYNPIKGTNKEDWAKELLLDPTYQLR